MASRDTSRDDAIQAIATILANGRGWEEETDAATCVLDELPQYGFFVCTSRIEDHPLYPETRYRPVD